MQPVYRSLNQPLRSIIQPKLRIIIKKKWATRRFATIANRESSLVEKQNEVAEGRTVVKKISNKEGIKCSILLFTGIPTSIFLTGLMVNP